MRRVAIVLLVLLGLGLTPVFAATKAAPTVSVTSPEPGVTFATDQVDVTAVYAAPSGAAISKVELLVDGLLVQSSVLDPAETSGTLTLTWEASGYLDGQHKLVMRVTDTKGRVAKAGIPTLLKRGQPEARTPVRITSPVRAATVSGVIPFRVEAAEGSSAKYVIFLVDNVFKAMSNLRPFSYDWDTSNYLNGPHTLRARAYLADGTDWLTPAFEVVVDNPSGATALRAPAPVAVPAPKAPAAPARTSAAPLPPAKSIASPTPYRAPSEVTSGEIGVPGSAPYWDQSREIVQPPTSVLATRTPGASELKVVTVEEATAPDQAAAPAGEMALSTPPLPSPARVAAPVATGASLPAAETTAEASPIAAPVQMGALPTPGSALSRTEAARSLPPVGAVAASGETSSGAVRSSQPQLSKPLVPAQKVASPTVTVAPKVATETARPAASVASKGAALLKVAAIPEVAPLKPSVVPIKPHLEPIKPALKPIAPTYKPIQPTVKPIQPTVGVPRVKTDPPVKQTAPLGTRAVPPVNRTYKPASTPAVPPAGKSKMFTPAGTPAVSPANKSKMFVPAGMPVYKAVKVAAATPVKPVQMARLPEAPVVVPPAPALTAEVKPAVGDTVIVNGEPLAGALTTVTFTDADGNVRKLIPLRAVIEQLGGTVLWQHETKQAVADSKGHRVIVTIQHIAARVNGKTIQMAVSPVLVEGRTMVHARFLAEALNLSLEYQDNVLRLAVN